MELLRVPSEHGMIDTTGPNEANRSFIRTLSGFGERSAWNAWPSGIVFSSRSGDMYEFTVSDELLMKSQVLYRTLTPDEIETLSATPDGLSVVYSTRARRTGEIDLLEPITASQSTHVR